MTVDSFRTSFFVVTWGGETSLSALPPELEKSLNDFKLGLFSGLKTFLLKLAGLPISRPKRELTFYPG